MYRRLAISFFLPLALAQSSCTSGLAPSAAPAAPQTTSDVSPVAPQTDNGASPPDTPPPSTEVPARASDSTDGSCQEGTYRCKNPQVLERCTRRSGALVWRQYESCVTPKTCDEGSNSCRARSCQPGQPICAPGGHGTTVCATDGSGPVAVTPKVCPPQTYCFDGQEGCVAVACPPGALGCAEHGSLGICDGVDYIGPDEGCVNDPCVVCPTPDTVLLCPSQGSPSSPASLSSAEGCPPNSHCTAGLGCVPDTCTAGVTRCGRVNAVGTCMADGVWTASECSATEFCATTSPITAACTYDCSADLDCKIAACDPLPAFLTDSEAWTPPTNTHALSVSFGVGLTESGKNAFVNISPIQNPQTGTFLNDLQPFVQTAAGATGHIAVFEDQSPRAIVCKPLSATQYARLDIAFVLDVTGSMDTSIEKVKTSTQSLAAFLQGKGLDLRFAVVPFTDVAPSVPLFDLSASLPAFSAYVGALQAFGGGDNPENGLDALMVARDDLQWRPGAQKVMLLMTDADLHQSGDGTFYAQETTKSVLAALDGEWVVHTVSSVVDTKNTPYADPRLLSCATGGSAAQLNGFVSGDIESSLFAQALARSFLCVFTTVNPFGTHDVRVDVRYELPGSSLFGSAVQQAVTYPKAP